MELVVLNRSDAPILPTKTNGSGSLLLPIFDLVTFFVCFSLGGLVNLSYSNLNEQRSIILVLLTTGCIVFFQQMGHYSRRRQFWQETGDVVVAAGIALVIDAALLYLFKVNFSRAWVITSWMLVALTIPAARFSLKRLSLHLGGWKRPTVVIGTGPIALETADAYVRDTHLGYDVIAFIDPDVSSSNWREFTIGERQLPVHPLDAESHLLPGWLGRPHIVVALELGELPSCESLIERLSLYYGDLDIISPMRGLPINNARASHFFTYDILSLRICNNLAKPYSQLMKRWFDILVASGILLFIAPLMALIAFLVWREGQPVFFAHTRVGRHGQLFKCLKFRSMVPNAAEVLETLLSRDPAARREWEKDYKLKNDPRITPLGRFLRKSSLDELPQLINVIRGEMSLVGPRPVVPDELERYGDGKRHYLEVRPGITGLWQISGRNDLDYGERVNLDTWYVRNWTLWYDIFILFKTVVTVPAKSGAY
jgi:undecaprenyl-phosphate galactose phosphotransferase